MLPFFATAVTPVGTNISSQRLDNWISNNHSVSFVFACSGFPSLSPFSRDTFLSCFVFCLSPVLLLPERNAKLPQSDAIMGLCFYLDVASAYDFVKPLDLCKFSGTSCKWERCFYSGELFSRAASVPPPLWTQHHRLPHHISTPSPPCPLFVRTPRADLSRDATRCASTGTFHHRLCMRTDLQCVFADAVGIPHESGIVCCKPVFTFVKICKVLWGSLYFRPDRCNDIQVHELSCAPQGCCWFWIS